LMTQELADTHKTSGEKAELLVELRTEVIHQNTLNKQKLADLTEADDKIDYRTQMIEDNKGEIANLRKALNKKDAEIAKLRFKIDPNAAPLVAGFYRPLKGDQIDNLFGNMLNDNGVTLPITRMGPGNYMFGTTKIFCTKKNNNLMIRTGGGATMTAEDFL